MAAEDFFNRWSRRKAEERAAEAPAAPAQPEQAAEPLPPPTMEDVDRLAPDSDFSRFMGASVEPGVKNSALKKLFAQPNFNVMDRLDIYIDDYGIPDPMPAAMLASLRHARDLLDPIANLEKPLMRVLDLAPAETTQTQAGEAGENQPAETPPVEGDTSPAPAAEPTRGPEHPGSNDEHPV